MKFLINRQIKKAAKLYEDWKIEDANAILSDLDKKHPKNDKIKFHFGITQNSLGQKEKAIELLETCLRLNPKNKDARSILIPILLETADLYEGNDLIKLKEKFQFLEEQGFQNIGLDLAAVYKNLAEISKFEGDFKEASRYLKLAKEIYLKDNFLREYHVDSGKIDSQINDVENLK